MNAKPRALLVVAAALACAGAALPPPLAVRLAAPPAIERALSTQASEGIGDVKGLRAKFYVHAPREKVLETLWDIDRFLEIFPDIKKLEVLQRRAEADGRASVDAKFTVDAVLANVTYLLRRDLDREQATIRWREIGGDVQTIRGSWTVEQTPHEDLTLVTYASFVDVGRFVPESMVRDLAIDKVEEIAGRVRKACEAPPR